MKHEADKANKYYQDVMDGLEQDMKNIQTDSERINGIYSSVTNTIKTLTQMPLGQMDSNPDYQADFQAFTETPAYIKRKAKTDKQREKRQALAAEKKRAKELATFKPEEHFSADYRGGLAEEYVKLKAENERLSAKNAVLETKLVQIELTLALREKSFTERVREQVVTLVGNAINRIVAFAARVF